MTQDSEHSKPRRAIYLLPNLFTSAAMFSGFYAIVTSMHGDYKSSAVAIFVAMVMDTLDGRVARLTDTESAFGMQFDSLSDLVSFGLAPALVMYSWALSGMSELGWVPAKLGWLAAFLYAVCTALRLARFNIQTEETDKRYFIGLPSPSAAAVTMGLVWVCSDAGINGRDLLWLAFPVTIAAGVLMVSNVRYHSFKQLDLRKPVSFMAILIMVLILVLVFLHPPVMLFSVFAGYCLSGPVLAAWKWWHGDQ